MPTWNEQRLLDLIENRTTESITLDYKRAGALQRDEVKKNEVSKDVSAFANSAGGTLIYGMEENGHVPTRLDGVDPATISKEWLDQVINSRIQPRVNGVIISAIELQTTAPGKMAYVVEIPQGKKAHQASDMKYYKRFNFESVPMNDYEIRDVNRRGDGPDLFVNFELNNVPPEIAEQHSAQLSLNIIKGAMVSIANKGAKSAEYFLVSIAIDSRITLINNREHILVPNAPIIIGGRRYDVQMLNIKWSIPGKMPIWEDEEFLLLDSPLDFLIPRNGNDFIFYWKISAPGMMRKRFHSFLKTDDVISLTEPRPVIEVTVPEESPQ